MKRFLVVFLLIFVSKVSAQTPQIPKYGVGVDTLMIQTVYTDLEGVEHTEPVKTLRVMSNTRSGTTTMYYSLNPQVLDSHVRRRIFPETSK
ncbi:hypothetical protein BWI93_23740 [Siphonobacter sp. BAB-5385]|uniref:hypothetical protein n=1 Tax=unclassified Siphonobacter TaxID=2635712 RepID=UPI000B9DF932|nr:MULTISPECIES: hypothetical protein [unclassified Siphonobacter]OZI05754.1 hypothetical protein BWI93_23740 [Siphonobacter sp. BAB-5385]PMD94833.1 hypothetical protein BWI97_15665 [Siphonobacter sp. BAB-5405]